MMTMLGSSLIAFIVLLLGDLGQAHADWMPVGAIRTAATLRGAPIVEGDTFTTLSAGTSAVIMEAVPGWYRLLSEKGESGWTEEANVEIVRNKANLAGLTRGGAVTKAIDSKLLEQRIGSLELELLELKSALANKRWYRAGVVRAQ